MIRSASDFTYPIIYWQLKVKSLGLLNLSLWETTHE